MARMQKKHKVFIAVGILLNLVLCLGLYVNNRLDNMVAGLYQPRLVNTDNSSEPGGDPAGVGPGSSGSGSDTGSGTAGTSGEGGYKYSPRTSTVESPSTSDLTSGVEQKLGQPVDKKDLVKAGMIVMRKLTWDEITFLYNAGNKPKQSPEELRQAREILKAKLTAEELATLMELGGKYGQSLKFLN